MEPRNPHSAADARRALHAAGHAGYARWAQNRDLDGIWFADWSLGNDQYGLWCWADWQLKVIVVRPSGMAMIDRIQQLGGRRQAWHRYDHQLARRDWYVPLDRWQDVHRCLPELSKMRSDSHKRNTIQRLPAWQLFDLRVNGMPARGVYSHPSRTFAPAARALGARFREIFDRPGWWIARDTLGCAEFERLVEQQR